MDIDFLFYTNASVDKAAADFLEKLGLKVGLVRENDLTRSPGMNKRSKPVFIAVGRDNDRTAIGIDFLLPPFPWFTSALERSQKHKIDFGFAKLPAVTVEDMILMKLEAKRNKDLDDLESIFKARHELDLNYLQSEMNRMALKVPKVLRKHAPKQILS